MQKKPVFNSWKVNGRRWNYKHHGNLSRAIGIWRVMNRLLYLENNALYLKVKVRRPRSFLPKFDELLVLTDSHCPDVICITESWLCLDILDSEISIPGYQTIRLNRNRHGANFLTLNRAKCKFMTISRRRAVSTPPTSLLLDPGQS